MTEQEIQRLLSTLHSSMGSFTNAIDRANHRVDELSNGILKEDKEFDKRAQKMAKWNKAEDAERLAALKQYRDHIGTLKQLEHEQRENVAKHTKKLQELDSGLNQLQVARAKNLAAAKKGDVAADKLADNQLIQIKKLLKAKAEERTVVADLTKQLNRDLGNSAQVQQKIVGKMMQTERELSQFSWKDAGKKVGSKLGDAAMSGIKSAFSGLSVGKAIATAYDNLTDVMATGGDNVLASAGKQMDLVKLGLSPEEYIKMNAASRQTILTTGGVNQQLSILSDQTLKLHGHFKTVGDATKFTQAQMNLLAHSGIKPNITNAGLLNDSFKKMQSYTGMTGDAFMQLQQEMAADSDITAMLRSANMAEREQILANNAARVAENVALGMTTEQAKNVAKSMAKMANTGPLDRIKQAAKMRALGAAMGVEGGDRAANIHLQGQRASDEDKKWFQEWTSKMSNTMSESKTGSLTGEILASSLQKALGNELTGPDSVTNTRLAEGLRISDDALKQQVKVNENLAELIRVTQQAMKAKENPYVQATGGVGGSLAGMFGSGALGAVGGWAGSKLGFPKITTVPGSAAPAAGGAASAAGGAASSAAGRTGAKALGKAALKKIPVVGALAGLGFAAGRLMDGDTVGAGMEAASGIAGAVPGVGTAASIGIDAALAARDVSKIVPPNERPAPQSNTTPQVDNTTKAPPVLPLTSAENRADATSPIGLQLSKMDESNTYLRDLTQLSTKQLELAEKQLAATVVSQGDKAELYKTLASGNKFMTAYSTYSTLQ